MATIISSKKHGNNKVVAEVLADYDEFLQLKGHLNDVYLFTNNVAEIQTNISQRGKNEATKYFLIPRELRQDMKFTEKVKCQKLETESKIIFVYVVDKLSF